MPSATLSSEGATLNRVLGTGKSFHFSTSVHSRVDVPVPMILVLFCHPSGVTIGSWRALENKNFYNCFVIVNSFIYFSHLPTCNKAVPSPGRWRMHRHNGLAHR